METILVHRKSFQLELTNYNIWTLAFPFHAVHAARFVPVTTLCSYLGLCCSVVKLSKPAADKQGSM